MLIRIVPGIAIVSAALALIATSSAAPQQQQFQWPEKPANIKVLDKEIVGLRLRPVMVGFSNSLGVRCSYCHKGVEGSPLTTYDFASDENPTKEKAREMLRMLKHINEDLQKIQPSGDERVNMWCFTCHRGRPRPMTLEEELGEQYRKNGVEAALETYADLKQRYYGRGAYDFNEQPLNNFGYTLLEKNDTAAAIQAFRLNAFEYPQSSNVWDSLAEGYMKSGDMKHAEEYYERAIARDPKAENAKQMLMKIREQQGK